MWVWEREKEIKSHWNRIKSLNKGTLFTPTTKTAYRFSTLNNVCPGNTSNNIIVNFFIVYAKMINWKTRATKISMKYLKFNECATFSSRILKSSQFSLFYSIDVLILDGKQNKIVDSATQEYESNLIKSNTVHTKNKWPILINLSFVVFFVRLRKRKMESMWNFLLLPKNVSFYIEISFFFFQQSHL